MCETLRAAADFERLFNSKNMFFSHGVLVKFVKSSSLDFKFAIAVPKRFGKAVKRNKLRRRLKEIVRLSANKPDFSHIVFSIRRSCESFSYSLLRAMCDESFTRIGKAALNGVL
ncbi:MAG: ribonuclease P protein component [Candidatus Riflebacteria bacterium]|nr:ribonuclease P protein component [Candidatus Riflebacteria bacterium]